MENSSTPLADYFWIAGVESVSYNDPTPPNAPVESTIAEDGEPEDEFLNRSLSMASARHSRHSSNRLSRISVSDRFSIQTALDENDGTMSNRSSATIRPIPPPNFSASNGSTTNGSNGLNGLGLTGFTSPEPGSLAEFDFDKALVKFAAEREVFLEDLSFSAGAKVQARVPMVNPRTERIKAEEAEPSGRLSPLRSIKGSIRRKMSFRDMNSVRKQPSTRIPNNRACTSPS
jgi:hypothetical protein